MFWPKVTIGVCVRNCANTIQDAIQSIIAQDYPHDRIEIIFVDDGSHDETLSKIKECAARMDMKVKIFHHRWKGIGYSRNVVVRNANGDYILWIDGDMVISSNFLRKLVKFMEDNPNVGIAKGTQTMEAVGNLLSTLENYSRAIGRMVDYTSEKARFKSLGTGGAIYRVKAIKQAGLFDEKLRGYGEDQDLEIRIRNKGWLLQVVNVKFYDYERKKVTWKDLWKRYWLRGYYTRYFSRKNRGVIKHYKMIPLTALIAGLIHAVRLYRIVRQRLVFFLPLQYLFKMSAWYIGYLNNYGNL